MPLGDYCVCDVGIVSDPARASGLLTCLLHVQRCAGRSWTPSSSPMT